MKLHITKTIHLDEPMQKKVLAALKNDTYIKWVKQRFFPLLRSYVGVLIVRHDDDDTSIIATQ